jgi:hypothetical protein
MEELITMRLWTLHPQFLDSRGLVALWREGLLAQAVLQGRTKGYRSHPQLRRFRDCEAPREAVAQYLRVVHEEAQRRGYRFDGRKIGRGHTAIRIDVQLGQIAFEWRHLRAKVALRAPQWLDTLDNTRSPEVHPLFRVVAGDIEAWERERAHREGAGR